MPVQALDSYYLALTLLITVGYQLSGFFIAYTLQFDKITDFTGGSNFFILALVTLLCGGTYHTRNVVASVFVMVWAVRIAGFLLFRVLKTGSDGRFDDIRKHFFKFLAFWIAQIFWVWIVSLPVTILNSPAISDVGNGGSDPSFGTSRDIAGIVLWSLGLFIEATADIQKYRFKTSKSSPKNQPINTGLWAWSRNPPYFGEMMCWWGIWILCLSPSTNGSLSSSARSAQYAAILSPIFTVVYVAPASHSLSLKIRISSILMFASGLPTSTKPQAQRYYLKSYGPDARPEDADVWDRYKAHLRRTSVLIPIPPVLYKFLPTFIKKTVLFDFPMYQFNEQKDGPRACKEASKTAE
ncbi:DUF1295-domain-containing protein [Favolaschia claudopus]|uniref:DUF1295-domain-containing protein n=1 Tax=Favolaschia claudopus TaxID=2862362 RepID=A0AAW0BXI3_9AGAR